MYGGKIKNCAKMGAPTHTHTFTYIAYMPLPTCATKLKTVNTKERAPPPRACTDRESSVRWLHSVVYCPLQYTNDEATLLTMLHASPTWGYQSPLVTLYIDAMLHASPTGKVSVRWLHSVGKAAIAS
jgi:hypothetical protein